MARWAPELVQALNKNQEAHYYVIFSFLKVIYFPALINNAYNETNK
jgi:hypothetical protein